MVSSYGKHNLDLKKKKVQKNKIVLFAQMAQRAHSNLVPPHLFRFLWDEKRRAAQTEADLCLAAVCLLTNEALWQHIIPPPTPPPAHAHTQIRCLNESDFFSRASVIQTGNNAVQSGAACSRDAALESEPSFWPLLFGFSPARETKRGGTTTTGQRRRHAAVKNGRPAKLVCEDINHKTL